MGRNGIGGKSLGLDAGIEDALDRGVAGLAEAQGPAARPSQACGAMLVGQSDDALGRTKPVERALAEHSRNELERGGPDLGGPLEAVLRGRKQPGDLVRRVVVPDRAARPRRSPLMARYPLILMEDVNVPTVAPDPEAFADEAVRSGVVGTVEDDVAVGMEPSQLPGAHVERIGREGHQPSLLDLEEARQRALLGRAVDTNTGDLLNPGEKPLVRLRDVPERAGGEEVALDVAHARLDLALVPRRPRPAGRDQEAVVLGEVPVAALEHGVVKDGLDDPGLQVVEHDLLRDAAEVLEGLPVAPKPGLDLLVEDEGGVLVPAVGQGHHEDPGAADLAGTGIDHLPAVPEVHLGFFPGLDLDTHVADRPCALQLDHVSPQGGVASGVPVSSQAVMQGDDLEAVLAQLPDHLVELLRLEALTGLGLLDHPCGQQPIQVLRRRQRPLKQAVFDREDPVRSDSLARDGEITRHRAVTLAGPKPTDQFANIQGHESPSCHEISPLGSLVRTGKVSPLAGRIMSGRLHAPSLRAPADPSRIRGAAPNRLPATAGGSPCANMGGNLSANTGGNLSANMVATMRRSVTAPSRPTAHRPRPRRRLPGSAPSRR